MVRIKITLLFFIVCVLPVLPILALMDYPSRKQYFKPLKQAYVDIWLDTKYALINGKLRT